MIKSAAFILLSALFSSNAFSSEVIRCQFKPQFEPEADTISVVIEKNEKEELTFKLISEKITEIPVLEVLDRALPQVEEILACDINSNSLDDCMEAYSKKYEFNTWSESLLPRELTFIQSMTSDPELGISLSFPLQSIARVKKYTIAPPNKFGQPGLNEYYNNEGQLLGRVLFPGFGIEECKAE